jgi:hypothetical protein
MPLIACFIDDFTVQKKVQVNPVVQTDQNIASYLIIPVISNLIILCYIAGFTIDSVEDLL